MKQEQVKEEQALLLAKSLELLMSSTGLCKELVNNKLYKFSVEFIVKSDKEVNFMGVEIVDIMPYFDEENLTAKSEARLDELVAKVCREEIEYDTAA